MNTYSSPDPSLSPQPSQQLKSHSPEQSIIDFASSLLSAQIQQIGTISPPKEYTSCFKQIIEFQNEESSEGEDKISETEQKQEFPIFDFMGHLLPVNIEIKKFDEDSEEEEIDSDKENSCKKMYLETPMKLNPLSRSPLQDITPSIRKKSKHKLTSFTYQKNNFLHQTPKTMADSRRKTDSSSRLKVFRI